LNTSVPITMPSAIAIKMYCVNLLDISYPRKFHQRLSLADFGADATRFLRRPACHNVLVVE
jgi:hypothetical protein